MLPPTYLDKCILSLKLKILKLLKLETEKLMEEENNGNNE